MKPLTTFVRIVASLVFPFTTGLSAGWLQLRYDERSGFEAEARATVDPIGLAPDITVLASTDGDLKARDVFNRTLNRALADSSRQRSR